MTVFVPKCFLFEVFLKCFRQINSSLIREANQYPKYIGHLITQVQYLVGFFLRLFTITPGHNTRNFPYLFRQYRGVGELTKVPYTIGFDPSINFLLGHFNSHRHCYQISEIKLL